MNTLAEIPLAELLAEVARRRRKISGMLDSIDASVTLTTDSDAQRAIVAASKAWGVTPEALASSSRTAKIAEARMAVMVHLRGKGNSLQEIGDVFGKDHGTVIHGIRTLTERAKTNAEVAARIEAFNGELQRFERQPQP